MRRSRAVLLAAATVCSIGQVKAAPDTGTRIEAYPRAEIDSYGRDPKVVARRVILDYGRCLLRYSSRSVDRLLTVAPGTPEYRKKALDLAVSECLQAGEIHFAPSLLRGALYAALYADRFGHNAPDDLAKAPEPVWWRVDAGDPEQGNALGPAQVGACVARASAGPAHMLTLSVAGTRAETNAFAALSSFLGGCLPVGQQFTFSKDVVRASVAEGLYRLRSAVPATPVGGVARH